MGLLLFDTVGMPGAERHDIKTYLSERSLPQKEGFMRFYLDFWFATAINLREGFKPSQEQSSSNKNRIAKYPTNLSP